MYDNDNMHEKMKMKAEIWNSGSLKSSIKEKCLAKLNDQGWPVNTGGGNSQR